MEALHICQISSLRMTPCKDAHFSSNGHRFRWIPISIKALWFRFQTQHYFGLWIFAWQLTPVGTRQRATISVPTRCGFTWCMHVGFWEIDSSQIFQDVRHNLPTPGCLILSGGKLFSNFKKASVIIKLTACRILFNRGCLNYIGQTYAFAMYSRCTSNWKNSFSETSSLCYPLFLRKWFENLTLPLKITSFWTEICLHKHHLLCENALGNQMKFNSLYGSETSENSFLRQSVFGSIFVIIPENSKFLIYAK